MTQDTDDGGPTISRRAALAAAGACFALASRTAAAAPASGAKARFVKEPEADGMHEYTGIHGGKGAGRARYFQFDGAAAPANFMIYELPPGASEGVHTHHLDDRNQQGAYDEYYYVISGQGQMEIDGRIVPVGAGDHVHAPLEVSHGIENTHPTDDLRVFLTYILRGREASGMRG